MSSVLYIPAAAMAALFCTVLLKECGFRGFGLVSTVGIIALFVLTVGKIGELLTEIREIADGFGIADTAALAVKAVGISYCFGIASDICRNMGESGIASAVDSIGRLELALLSLPLIKQAVEMGVGLING